MMEWRKWTRDQLISDGRITNPTNAIDAIPESRIFGGGSVKARPETMFIIIAVADQFERTQVGVRQTEITINVHDDPGSYLRVDRVLKDARDILEKELPDAGAISVEWQGESNDLADDGWDTVYRFASFRMLDKL